MNAISVTITVPARTVEEAKATAIREVGRVLKVPTVRLRAEVVGLEPTDWVNEDTFSGENSGHVEMWDITFRVSQANNDRLAE